MVELAGLNKDFFDALLATYEDSEKEHGKKSILDRLERDGGVIKKDITAEGFPRFYMKDGGITVCAPRGHKFSAPLIPEGMDIKQFEVK